MLHQYNKELKEKVRKELIELLAYDPAPPGSLQAIGSHSTFIAPEASKDLRKA